MVEFLDFIFDEGLMDIPLVRDTPFWSSIDRFLVSPDWEAQYLDLSKKRLSRLCSNHFPILLNCEGIQGGRIHFKFENMWLKFEGFVDRVK
jgi:hypothetical protein